MTTKGILMSGPMVRGLLDDLKTQTRRVLRRQPNPKCTEAFQGADGIWRFSRPTALDPISYSDDDMVTPYLVGDRLYVREAHAYHGTGWCNQTPDETKVRVEYLADNQDVEFIVPTKDVENFIPKQNKPKSLMVEEVTGDSDYDRALAQENWLADWWTRQKKRPPMFMFRHWSRLWLEVTDVRVQRVQDITEEDAFWEGIKRLREGERQHQSHYRFEYRELWDSLNAKPKPVYVLGSEDKKVISHYISYPWGGERRHENYRGKIHYIEPNPWVAAYTFTVHRGNVDG